MQLIQTQEIRPGDVILSGLQPAYGIQPWGFQVTRLNASLGGMVVMEAVALGSTDRSPKPLALARNLQIAIANPRN